MVEMRKINVWCFIGCFIVLISFTGCKEKKVDSTSGNVISNISKNIDDSGVSEDAESLSLSLGYTYENLVKVGTDYRDYGNLSQNIFGQDNPVLLCKDPVYDITYYVNYGVDYFIYGIKDGKTELLVELPGKNLYSRDGILYFVLESYETYQFDDLKSGAIYSYDPLTGIVSCVVDQQVDDMYVYEDGIYYEIILGTDKVGETEIFTMNIERYVYEFDTKEVKSLEKNGAELYQWRHYFIENELEPVEPTEDEKKTGITSRSQVVAKKLVDKESNEEILLTDLPIVFEFQIHGDELFYAKDEIMYAYDLYEYTTRKVVEEIDDHADYMYLDNRVYQSDFYYNLDTGIKEKLTYLDGGHDIRWNYTDGVNLYGLAQDFEMKEGAKMYRITIEQAEFGRAYKLHPMQ